MASHNRERDKPATGGLQLQNAGKKPSGTTYWIKFWACSGIAFLILAVAIRLGWEYVDGFNIERFSTITLSIACVLGIGGLLIAMVLDPRRLRSPVFFTLVAAIVSLGLVGGLIHYVRFVFISDVPPLAIVIATALTLATLCGFVLILYAIRWLRRRYPEPQPAQEDESGEKAS